MCFKKCPCQCSNTDRGDVTRQPDKSGYVRIISVLLPHVKKGKLNMRSDMPSNTEIYRAIREAVDLEKYANAAECVFCVKMAEVYGCIPAKREDNLYLFMISLFHYGIITGIRKERARRKGEKPSCR